MRRFSCWDQLCSSVFDSAQFRQTKGALKLHVQYDHGYSIPTAFVVTDGKTHDMPAPWAAYPIEKNSILPIDRANTDLAFLHSVHRAGAFFVNWLKSNARYEVVEHRQVKRRLVSRPTDTFEKLLDLPEMKS